MAANAAHPIRIKDRTIHFIIKQTFRHISVFEKRTCMNMRYVKKNYYVQKAMLTDKALLFTE